MRTMKSCALEMSKEFNAPLVFRRPFPQRFAGFSIHGCKSVSTGEHKQVVRTWYKRY